MKIYYGILENKIDVTDICFSRLRKDNIITIPFCDIIRAYYFTDPIFGVNKNVIIELNNSVSEFNEFIRIEIDVINNNITTLDEYQINQKWLDLKSKLTINYGSFNEEIPEQKMVIRYLTGKEKVLEIGANIGRNTLIIASLLENSRHLVALETDQYIFNQLLENKHLNKLNFNLENCALSNRKLIQTYWDSLPSEILLDGYNWVNIISYPELKSKFNIEFDTLVLDCEGAFFYILEDMPEILTNINLIIMENDYHDINKKNFVDEILKQHNFIRDYVEMGGWGPCYNNFFEVWKK